MSKKRMWNDGYVQYDFTFITEKDGTQRPQHVLCSTMFSNSNFKSLEVDEHFKYYGGRNAGNDIATLRDKRAGFDVPTFCSHIDFYHQRNHHYKLVMGRYQIL